jgi:hypothetical protein
MDDEYRLAWANIEGWTTSYRTQTALWRRRFLLFEDFFIEPLGKRDQLWR